MEDAGAAADLLRAQRAFDRSAAAIQELLPSDESVRGTALAHQPAGRGAGARQRARGAAGRALGVIALAERLRLLGDVLGCST